MRFGIDLPTTGDYADVRLLAALAREAEEAGWDGFFVYDQIAPEHGASLVDPWIALAAIAMATERVRFGPLVTPLARRRPWKVARETVTLDHLSGGRLIFGAGLGSGPVEFGDLGEAADATVRAAMLDEALGVLVGLWSGDPFTHHGAHYAVKTDGFMPRPLQTPRIPIWIAGTWPIRAPFRRAVRWDGVFPHHRDGMMPLEAVREVLAFVAQQRTQATPFEVVLRNKAPSGDLAQDTVSAALYAHAGVTWWLEGVEGRDSVAAMCQRIRQGPPRL